eukprot:11160300-Lingulodinium_polyedra.AAC.1
MAVSFTLCWIYGLTTSCAFRSEPASRDLRFVAVSWSRLDVSLSLSGLQALWIRTSLCRLAQTH